MAKVGAAGAAATAMGGGLLASSGGAQSNDTAAGGNRSTPTGEYDDSFSIEGALNGEWAAATSERYGERDERGTLNEITPAKTASALSMLSGASAVRPYNLGQLMRDPTPAFVNVPPRIYSQRIRVGGFQPANPAEWFVPAPDDQGADNWRAADLQRGPLGYLATTQAVGANQASSCEERFLHGGTYHIGTQLDHFPHFGVGDILYNGWRASEICTPKGFTALGVEKTGPLVTRGVLLDVLGYKLSQGGADVQTVNGNDMLVDGYRITVEDLQGAMELGAIGGFEPGDVILIRTGWWWLGEDPQTFDRFLATEPGIYIAEAKFLGENNPAIIGSDSWALEVVGNPGLTEWVFPVHTELLVRKGIHLGESIITHELAEAGIYEFVYSYVPQNAWGATGSNTPPVALVPVTAES